MIFVSFGTERFPFKRLCRYIEKLASQLDDDEEIIVQSGSTPCNIKHPNVKVYDFLKYSQFKKFVKEARIIIMHAGVGSFLDVVASGKVPILVPRKPEKKEHVDDQQIQLAKVLHKKFNVPVALTYKELNKSITALTKTNLKPSIKTYKKGLLQFLECWIKLTV